MTLHFECLEITIVRVTKRLIYIPIPKFQAIAYRLNRSRPCFKHAIPNLIRCVFDCLSICILCAFE